MNPALWMKNWLVETKRAYVGNATTLRDFRTQLRGGKSTLFWSVYLTLLCLMGIAGYASLDATGPMWSIQTSLQAFYAMLQYLLLFGVLFIAPALGATAIVAERQRRALDLVFSAPVSMKYYLIGKLLSCYRTIWMLLILSLPLAALGVCVGGATWQDVAILYALLSLHGLLYVTVGLFFSAIAETPINALLYTYVFLAAVIVGSSILGALSLFSLGFGAGSIVLTVLLSLVNPFYLISIMQYGADLAGSVPFFASTPSLFIALASGILLFPLIKTLLSGTASVLSGQIPEARNFRLHVLFGLVACSALLGWTLAQGGQLTGAGVWLHFLFIFGALPFLPSLCCWGEDRETRFRYDGVFRMRKLLSGTPSGTLPFLYGIVLLCYGTLALTGTLAGGTLDTGFLESAFAVVGAWTLLWGIGRFFSSARRELRSSRVLFGTVEILCVLFPAIVVLSDFLMLQAMGSMSGAGHFSGLVLVSPVGVSVVFFLLGWTLAWLSERRRHRFLAKESLVHA